MTSSTLELSFPDRVVASGFCISPASTLDGKGRILVTRFDFAGNAVFEDYGKP